MPTVLVTGGTGVVGRAVVAQLCRSGATVRILSRRPGDERTAVGDLTTGRGVAEALEGVDSVAHCASIPKFRHPSAEVDGTRVLLEAARRGGRPHVVYVSIVGVNRIPLGFYRAKLAAEQAVTTSGLGWTVLRASQFHQMLLQIIATATRLPVMALPGGFRFQPVDADAVGARLADLALRAPAGRVADVAGPRIERIEDLARSYLSATGQRRLLAPFPLPGNVARAFREGANLLDNGERLGRPFGEFLADRVQPDGTVSLSYARRPRH